MLEKTTRNFFSIVMKLKIKGYSTASVPFSLYLSFEYNKSFTVSEIVKIMTFVKKNLWQIAVRYLILMLFKKFNKCFLANFSQINIV